MARTSRAKREPLRRQTTTTTAPCAVAIAVYRHNGSHFARDARAVRAPKNGARMARATRAICEPAWRRT
eukprot:3940285-Lingulodinium_polyedra.AAC.1